MGLHPGAKGYRNARTIKYCDHSNEYSLMSYYRIHGFGTVSSLRLGESASEIKQ